MTTDGTSCAASGGSTGGSCASTTVAPSGSSAARGTVANNQPLVIAGKLHCDQVEVTCDYYRGVIDRVRIDR